MTDVTRIAAEPPIFLGQAPSVEIAPDAPRSPPPAEKILDPSIFIGNLPFTITEQTLTELLQQFGPLEGPVRLLLDGATGKPRGMAFADYCDMDSAAYAIHVVNGLLLDGRPVRANAQLGRFEAPHRRL